MPHFSHNSTPLTTLPQLTIVFTVSPFTIHSQHRVWLRHKRRFSLSSFIGKTPRHTKYLHFDVFPASLPTEYTSVSTIAPCLTNKYRRCSLFQVSKKNWYITIPIVRSFLILVNGCWGLLRFSLPFVDFVSKPPLLSGPILTWPADRQAPLPVSYSYTPFGSSHSRSLTLATSAEMWISITSIFPVNLTSVLCRIRLKRFGVFKQDFRVSRTAPSINFQFAEARTVAVFPRSCAVVNGRHSHHDFSLCIAPE